MVPERWNNCRYPSKSEINTTGILEILLEHISVKVNVNGPSEKKMDLNLQHWVGVIALKTIILQSRRM